MGNRIKMVGFLFFLLIIFIIFANYMHTGYKTNYKIEDDYTYSKNKARDYKIVIDVEVKKLELIRSSDNETIKSYQIATGKKDSPTPLGTFKITEKAKWGEGFGTRWLGLDVPWGIYGIHGTNKPGSIGFNLSAGCIRMRNRDVEELYEYVREDTIVYISNGIYGVMGNGFRNLNPGDRGADVLEVQKRLKQKGYFDGELDGIYGEITKSSLLSYLRDKDINPTHTINKEIYNSLGIILME